MSKGDDILLAARQHFGALRTVETLRRIKVPEWNDAELCYWPEMDVTEKCAIFGAFRGLRPDSAAQLLDAAVLHVLLRSRNAFGDRLFMDEHEAAIRATHPDVLLRIANEMGWGRQRSLEDHEKN